MKRLILYLLIMVFFSNLIYSQKTEHFFLKESEILKPFPSEIRSTTIKAELAFLNKLDENYYIRNYTQRPFVEVHLGTHLPLYSMVNHQRNIKFRTSFFMANNLLIDMFEEVTAPVINTDYFFGLQSSLLKYTDGKRIKNIGLKLVPLFHESTHIGDEFSLHGYFEIPDFKRINISYEAWEVALVLNDPDTIRTNLFSTKIGFHRLWDYKKGYYVYDSLETKGRIIPPSKKNYEYYIQINLQRTSGFLCSKKWMQVISAEANNRLQLSYNESVPEKRSWNFNVYLGWKYLSERRKNLGFYFRYYNGIIPNGQFRNTPGYQFVGFSMIYD